MKKHFYLILIGFIFIINLFTACKSTENITPGENLISENKTIGSEFPYESKFVDVLGSKMHYVEEGEGDTVLFLHGNPTSSYLWRNIIPYVSKDARAIAVDLIGMGKSEKPEIKYGFEDHARYLDAFISELGLKNITLVVHDWGSSLGFNYAVNNEDNIKAIVFMESQIKPLTWDRFDEKNTMAFKMLRDPANKEMMMNQNFMVEQVLPNQMMRKLTEFEMNRYREPFVTLESRELVWKWPTQIPISGEPENTHKIWSDNSNWLQNSIVPKLMLHASPGVLITETDAEWVKDNVRNVEIVNVGEGYHFIQEDLPHEIGEEISKWYLSLK
jgi:haloalkane dehalogenase